MRRPTTDDSPSPEGTEPDASLACSGPATSLVRVGRWLVEDDRGVAPATMVGLLLFVGAVLGGILALTVVTA